MTTVRIVGEEFYLDDRPTYPGRTYEGLPVEGLLFNVRAVQATFDDANPATARWWVYPDTGRWDPERNVADFMAALPSWREQGILGFTLGFQGGGSRYAPEVYDHYRNSAFTPQGDLLSAYADRVRRVLARADELGMVVIASLFYWRQVTHFESEQAVWRAVDNALAFLADTGRRNVVVEIANETDIQGFKFPIFAPENAHRAIVHAKNAYPQFLVATSFCGLNLTTGKGIPPDAVIEAGDLVLIHGNGTTPETLGAGIDYVKARPAFQRAPKPVVINEDSTGLPNLETAWRRYVSWGYYDQGYNGEPRRHDRWVPDQGEHTREARYADLSGFQTVPVNWTINTPRKRAFFERVAAITGASPARGV